MDQLQILHSLLIVVLKIGLFALPTCPSFDLRNKVLYLFIKILVCGIWSHQNTPYTKPQGPKKDTKIGLHWGFQHCGPQNREALN